MGKGIDLARPTAPIHAAALDDLKDQLLIVFLKRLRALGHPLDFPLSEIDDTGGDLLAFSIRDDPQRGQRVFHFDLRRKS